MIVRTFPITFSKICRGSLQKKNRESQPQYHVLKCFSFSDLQAVYKNKNMRLKIKLGKDI